MDAHWPLAFQRSKSSSSDKQVAEALRYFISDSTYSGSSRSVDCHLLSKYDELLTTSLSNSGINNYADAVLQLISGQRNDSDSWESQLSFTDYAKSLDLSLDSGPLDDDVHIPQFVGEISIGEKPENCGDKFPCNLVAQTATFMSNNKRPLEQLPQEVQGTKFKAVDCKADSFKTAREQLIIDAAKNKNSSLGINSYGQNKKHLGPRRFTGKFCPPVVQENNITEMLYNENKNGETTARSSSKINMNEEEAEIPEELAYLDPKIVKLIMNEILDSNAGLTWDDIAGLQFVKKTIKEIIVLPMLRPYV
ncbi:FIGNL1 [Bugula neritina]|uniref:FIGNL1 n=1 Tax=Bugula neritina TaxID=10212 RepID=A0A7J7J3X4_BUGNE|nr:FIGNL1 [Bugula neritina]